MSTEGDTDLWDFFAAHGPNGDTDLFNFNEAIEVITTTQESNVESSLPPNYGIDNYKIKDYNHHLNEIGNMNRNNDIMNQIERDINSSSNINTMFDKISYLMNDKNINLDETPINGNLYSFINGLLINNSYLNNTPIIRNENSFANLKEYYDKIIKYDDTQKFYPGLMKSPENTINQRQLLDDLDFFKNYSEEMKKNNIPFKNFDLSTIFTNVSSIFGKNKNINNIEINPNLYCSLIRYNIRMEHDISKIVRNEQIIGKLISNSGIEISNIIKYIFDPLYHNILIDLNLPDILEQEQLEYNFSYLGDESKKKRDFINFIYHREKNPSFQHNMRIMYVDMNNDHPHLCAIIAAHHGDDSIADIEPLQPKKRTGSIKRYYLEFLSVTSKLEAKDMAVKIKNILKNIYADFDEKTPRIFYVRAGLKNELMNSKNESMRKFSEIINDDIIEL